MYRNAKDKPLLHRDRERARFFKIEYRKSKRLLLWILSLALATYILSRPFWTSRTSNRSNSATPSQPSEPKENDVNSSQSHSSTEVECDTAFRSDLPVITYLIVMDAGSTGSRIHIYTFNMCSESPKLLSDRFEQIKPGLSHYAKSNPTGQFALEAARSLDVLLDIALDVIPKNQHECTPLLLGATAGLRLLPGQQADDIIDAVFDHLTYKYPFFMLDSEDAVAILDGKDEAVYAWLTINYLLDKFGSGAKQITAGVMDLGGGSTQLVFEPNYHDPKLTQLQPTCSAPIASLENTCGAFFVSKDLDPHSYTIYQHSYLGFGLMEARTRIRDEWISQLRQHEEKSHPAIVEDRFLKETVLRSVTEFHGKDFAEIDVDTITVYAHPCFPESFTHLLDQNTVVSGSHKGFNDSRLCSDVVRSLFDKDTCSFTPNSCSFNGIYQPDLHSTFTGHEGSEFFIFSYFFDRTRLILDMHDSRYDEWTLNDIKYLASLACDSNTKGGLERQLDVIEFTPLFQTHFGSPEKMREFLHDIIHRNGDQDHHLCSDLSYIYHLLSTGYGLPDGQSLRIQKKVADTEVGWALGAALDLLNRQLDRQSFCW